VPVFTLQTNGTGPDRQSEQTFARVLVVLAFQGSLLDGPSPALAGEGEIQRRWLPRGAWLDHAPGWLTGADALFRALADDLPWAGHRRWMYDREVDEPRVTAKLAGDELARYPVVVEIADALSARYEVPFPACWLNLYRDGHDSVAWHGDRIARDRLTSLVAIVSVGERRPFLLRPKGGGRSIAHRLGRGDLLVMGGTCQRTWDHSVPKVAAAGPRISLTFRPFGEQG
jgi:alkylated DNA repair dioxygenase AlkB